MLKIAIQEVLWLIWVFYETIWSVPLANVNYPRALRCEEDIVTRLWFRASVRVSLCPCVDLVNTIEIKPLCYSSSNLADMLTMMRGCNLLILEVRYQKSRSYTLTFWYIWKQVFEHDRDYTVVCYFIKLGRHVSLSETCPRPWSSSPLIVH